MGEVLDTKESWSWKKLLSGVFNGLNYGKALVFGLCLAIMLSIATLSVYGVLYIKGKLFPKKDETQRVLKVESQGGAVDASVTTKKSDFTIFKFGGTSN